MFSIRRGTDSLGRWSCGRESVQMCGVGGTSVYRAPAVSGAAPSAGDGIHGEPGKAGLERPLNAWPRTLGLNV